jgi:hypothetical protein
MDIVVYLCGPINGCTDEECKDWRYYVQKHLRHPTLDPMTRDYRGREDECFKEIVEGDKEDLDLSTHILVNYNKPSVGTSMEILYAWERGKKILIVAKADTRISPWMRYHSHGLVYSFDAAIKLLNEENQ